MSKHRLPPVPPAGRSPNRPGNPEVGDRGADAAEADPRHRNVGKQGRQGNIKVNTTNQGYQQDR